MKNKCKRNLAESKKNTIRMRNEVTAGSQLQVRERSRQADVCGEEEKKKFPGQKGSDRPTDRRRGLKRKVGSSLLQNPNTEHHTHTRALTLRGQQRS